MNKALTIGEAAARLDLSKHTVRKYLRNGVITGGQIGKCWRIDPQSLDAVLRGGAHGGEKQSEPDLQTAA